MHSSKQIVKACIIRAGEHTSESLGFVIGTLEYINELTDPTEDLVPMCRFLEIKPKDVFKELLRG